MNHDDATASVAHSARTSGALASSHLVSMLLLILLANVATAAAARREVAFSIIKKEARARRCTGELDLTQKPRRPSESE